MVALKPQLPGLLAGKLRLQKRPNAREARPVAACASQRSHLAAYASSSRDEEANGRAELARPVLLAGKLRLQERPNAREARPRRGVREPA